MTGDPQLQQELVKWLSYPRLAPYRLAADGNLSEAIDLYVWNSRISGPNHRGV
jgi:hypothetical protein